MRRRDFLAGSLAASTAALARAGAQQQSAAPAEGASGGPREYYDLRKYYLQSGPQTRLTDHYVADALIPALNRLGIAPVGAFHLEYGPETPTLYLVLPSSNVESLVTANVKLAEDAEFLKAADPFWNSPSSAPPFIRVESSLLQAFEGYPRLTVPAAAAQHGERIYQIRIYESATEQDHLRKLEMFHQGEFDIFRRAGASQVFYGNTLIGPRIPNLTYMLSFENLAALTASWKLFMSDPAWKKLSATPRYSFEPIVNNVSDLILTPAAYSQV